MDQVLVRQSQLSLTLAARLYYGFQTSHNQVSAAQGRSNYHSKSLRPAPTALTFTKTKARLSSSNTMKIRRNDKRLWHEGPIFNYHAPGKKIAVNVAGSSWAIRGLAAAKAVTKVLREFRVLGGNRVLDFGAGSWLRYIEPVRRTLPSSDIYTVEFEEAFHDDAAKLKAKFQSDVTFWTPSSFMSRRTGKFDLIFAINVLNTIPEAEHQREVFSCLSEHLKPLGWLLIYQRIWVESENPAEALPYGDGWLIPQTYGYYTYRAKTGAKWFNAQAAECKLRPVPIKTEITSSNTLLRVWEKPFA